MISAAAEVQRRLWGTDPQAWADLAEAHNQPLFEAVLDAAGARPGTRLLDVGCGSGLTLVLARERGALPSGVDISPGLLSIACDRLPHADLREADMESLPFGDAAFDAVTGVNAFQFAGDPRRALREAARVIRPGGRVVASLFAAPERSQGTVAHEAMSALIPPSQAGDHAPYALSAPGNLEAALRDAGLRAASNGEVVCQWRYSDMDEAVRALLCSAGGARAAEAVGPQAVREALRPALGQFQDPRDRRRQPAEHLPLGGRPPLIGSASRRPGLVPDPRVLHQPGEGRVAAEERVVGGLVVSHGGPVEREELGVVPALEFRLRELLGHPAAAGPAPGRARS